MIAAGVEAMPVPFREALKVWLEIGVTGFGGPAGQIALMHRKLVEERGWIGEAEYLRGLNLCMLLPGPEAMQLATYIGWRLHGVAGGIAAGTLFVLPGALLMLALAALYAAHRELPWLMALFFGIKCAVLAVVVEALLRIAKRALRGAVAYGTAALSFLALFAFAVPFPAVVLGAGLLGAALAWRMPAVLRLPDGTPAAPATAPVAASAHVLRTLAVWGGLWLAPFVLIAALGGSPVFGDIARLMSELAVVTFGGAYAVLAGVAQQAVEGYGWLSASAMLDGLGLAETTPGPLILVLEFVAYQAAYGMPGALDPMLAGSLGAALAVWCTFVPCFLWIFLAAPWVEAIGRARIAAGALALITAAVVGVVLNLSLWFALHVLFGAVQRVDAGWLHLSVPEWGTLDERALVLALASAVALLRFKLAMLWVLGAAALAGLALRSFVY
jgi:chromate transporter